MGFGYGRGVLFSVGILTVMTIGARYANAARDPVGIWLFDEDSGSVAADATGNGNDGTLINGPEWVDGKFGSALDLDGSAAYVDCGNDASLNTVDELTLVAWVLVHGNGLNNGIILIKGGSASSGEVSYSLVYLTNPRVFTFHLNTEDVTHSDHNTDDSVDTDRWYHLAGTYKPGELIIYVDGEPAATPWDHRSGPVVSFDGPLLIGREDQVFLELFNGIVDEAGVFGAALTQSEIQDIMNGGLASVLTAVEPRGKLSAMWGDIKRS
jgi:hypothetical protein